jgi:iron complex transport system substrate-binding protein
MILRPAIPVLLLLSACLPSDGSDAPLEDLSDWALESDEPRRLVDDAGREHRLSAPPTRIVSLVPSATEVLVELGAHHLLVARTDFDTAQVVRSIPSVGGGLQPSLEVLLALKPDLVIRFGAETDPFTPQGLDRAEVPHFAVRPERISDVRRMVKNLGRIVGRTEVADLALERLDAGLDSVREEVRDRPRPKVAYLLGGSPPWVAGPENFIDELLEIAGAENVFGDLPRPYTEVSLETLVSRAPDLLLVVEGVPLPENLPALSRVRRVSPLTRSPGLRLAEAARELARNLHPDGVR